MSRMYTTDSRTVVIGTILMIIALLLIAAMIYTEYTHNKRELDAEKEARKLKQERDYWKHRAEHPQLRVSLQGEGWEEIPSEHK